MRRDYWVIAWILLSKSLAFGANLPSPTGHFPVGRVTVTYRDDTRIEPLDPNHAGRRIAVDVWYPAQAVGAPSNSAIYLDLSGFDRAIGESAVRDQLRGAYSPISTGSVATHAIEGAAFAGSIGRCPVLVFSPGGGMVRELYSAQLADLASHGYVVAALTHPYDGFVSTFSDGTFIAYDSRRWPEQPSFEGEANLNQLEWHADDIRFVLDELSRDNPGAPFSRHLDLSRVGAFGHSFGGIAAARACQKDPRLKACLNEDGSIAKQPYLLDTRGWGMDQAFMLIERAPRTAPASDQELAQMKLTRERADALLLRLNSRRDRELRSTGRGTFRVVLRSTGTAHIDFSDLGVLGAVTPSEQEAKNHFLMVVGRYTRAFFDRYLLGSDSPILDRSSTDSLVESVEHFPPAKREY